MFYYDDQPCTPSFHSGLLKTESDFISRPVQTDLGRWTLVVAVIAIVDAYPFLALDRCFVAALCCLIDSGEMKLSNQMK